MSTRDDKEFAQRQVAAMDRFIPWAGDHPLMGPALKQRREEFDMQARQLPSAAPAPRAVLFFTGDPIEGSKGIEVEFMTKVLEHFQQMVKTQYAFTKHGRIGDRARQPGGTEAKLLLTGTPRGSFGLELSQPRASDLFTSTQLSATLVRLTQLIKAAGEDDETFGVELEDVTPRVLGRLRRFFKVLADSKTALRLESGDLSVRLDKERVTQAADRVAAVETKPEMVELRGQFRGATLDTWRFDFRTEAGQSISGRLADELSEPEAALMNGFTNQECVGTFNRISITARGGLPKERYELVAIRPASGNAGQREKKD